ncbi:MAG: NAD-dependent succinate-semialdehyde dehydrogenase [Maricaulaceae bacterium]
MTETAAIASSGPLERVKNRDLLRADSLINGGWRGDEGRFSVINPADGAVLAEVADLGEAGARAAVDAAADGLAMWRKTSAFERAAKLKAWSDAILAARDDLAVLMTAENGKPLREARGEAVYAASFVEWSAEEAKRLHGDILPSPYSGSRFFAFRQPIGVAGMVTPWNFPAAMITRKAAPALAAGCSVVVKPAPETPLTALALGQLALDAGLPPGVLNIVTGDAAAIGPVITGDPRIAIIGFTGSTAVGKMLMRQASETVKKVALELGGNSPFLVLEDADVDAAAAGAMAAKFRGSGQVCVAANRLLVHEAVADAFVDALHARMTEMRVDDGFASGVDAGPLIHDQALERVHGLVAQAQDAGAAVKLGGTRMDRPGSFYAPTLIDAVRPEMAIFGEEIFGPVAPVVRVKSDQEAFELANATPWGLAAYVYAQDAGRIFKAIDALDTGMLGVNTGVVSHASAPFGGVKQSGIGREGGKWGVEEFTEVKFVNWAGLE